MSYDLHGVWDKPNKWVGPYLNAHTNLTEIQDAMDLLWRNDIDSSKVNMGLAFYGRAFTAASPSCMAPGCTFESGAAARPCSNEVSVMMNSEILDVMDSESVTPVLDEDAAVKILSFGGNQWVAYDDEDTLQMKVEFAKGLCLGGVMVWAVSHDTQDATFSQALGEMTGRVFEPPTTILNVGGVDDTESVSDTSLIQQCKWTSCGGSK
ncbi:hypothetical protein KJ359_001476 [Pestalotiopsis sp. 9143b]|nr:hypothetical protein KJ359_001476 [Pestalotiopsis sp. 9143b]